MNIDYREIEAVLGQIMDKPLSFGEMVSNTIESGKILSLSDWMEMFLAAFKGQLHNSGKSVGYLLLLLLSSAMLSAIAKAFRSRQISDMGFYMIFLLMFLILVKSFGVCYNLTSEVIGEVTDFMKVLMPAYLMAVAMGAYQTTAVIYYEGFLVLVYYLQKVMEYVLLPGVRCYVLFSMISYLGEDNYFTKGRDALKKLILWILRAMIAATAGVQMIQGMITPAIDEMKHTVFSKGISSLGGLGNVAGNVTDVILGSGALLKNGIGAVASVILLSICLIPAVEVVCHRMFYQMLVILAEPISDKRFIGLLSQAGEGMGLLVKILFTVCALFLLTIAMACVTTGGIL